MPEPALRPAFLAEPDVADMTGLLERVRDKRDKAAFLEIFEYFAPRLKSYLIRQGARADEAEELVQETMLTVWRRAESFDGAKASASTWIFTIARNKRVDTLRKKKAVYTDIDQAEHVESEEGASVVDHMTFDKHYEQVQQALKELPDEQKDLLMRSFFDNQSHGDIAAATGLPLGTVKSRIRLAMDKLRRFMDKAA